MVQVLLVDDSDLDAYRAEKILTKSNISYFRCNDGIEVIPKLESMLEAKNEALPDLILLDIVMPEQDGFSTLRKIRAHSKYDNIPVIMLSSKQDAVDKFWTKKNGAFGHIGKPADAKELLTLIKQCTK